MSAWMMSPVRALLSVVLVCLVLSVFAEHAEARRLSWGAMKRYTLGLTATLTYDTWWGDTSDSSSLTHEYGLTHRGYVIDPRLAYYTVNVNFSDRIDIQGENDYTATGFSTTLSLFGGIDRKKGLKLWKYVPSPLVLSYSRHAGSGYTSQSYGLSAYYSRPGTLRVFSGRKIIAYDDGTKKNINLRRNVNSNRYGPGDNGSNWDGNINGNWNRNRNNNWNRNRNNNWNQNWNQNWNLSRNLDKELSWYRGLAGLLTFGYPSIGLDIHRSETKGGGDSFTSTIANLRVRISNPPRRKAGKVVYSARYAFYYDYRNTTRSGTANRLRVESEHDWRRFNLRNSFVRETGNDLSGYYISSSGTYNNYIEKPWILRRPVKYTVGAGGTYQKYGDATSYTAGGNARLSSKLGRPVRVSPYLYVDSGIGVRYQRSKSGTETRDVYSVVLTERLTYKGIKKTRLSGGITTGYTESGISVKLSIGADSALTRKLRLRSGYTFNCTFPSEHRGRSITHEVFMQPRYALRPNLTLSGGIRHVITGRSNGITERHTNTSAHAEMLWRINSRSNLNLRAYLAYTGSHNSQTYSASYTARVFRRSRIHLSGELQMSSNGEGVGKSLRASYNWWFGRTSFDAAYELVMPGSGFTNHRLNLRLSRTFGRTFSRLW